MKELYELGVNEHFLSGKDCVRRLQVSKLNGQNKFNINKNRFIILFGASFPSRTASSSIPKLSTLNSSFNLICFLGPARPAPAHGLTCQSGATIRKIPSITT